VGDIASQLASLLKDESRRSRLAAAARTRAGEFSWGKFAERVLETLDRAAAGE
jgi:glycosyltransferase involved in cell wall biosynthesis